MFTIFCDTLILYLVFAIAADSATDGREYGMQNLGVMVPLLDILNHDSSQEWLRFEVKDEALQVICNVPRKKVNYLCIHNGTFRY